MTHLFSSLTVKDVTLRNRMAVAPMCTYQAENGVMNDWHFVHYGALGRGGAGLVVVEATAVSPEGRISPNDVGLWDDAHIAGHARVAELIKAAGAVAGIQIAHAGRKASANRPWDGDDHIAETDPKGWQTIAPSALAFGANLPRVPMEMTKDDIARVIQSFAKSAQRAAKAGYQWLQLHFAHGYLAQEFLCPHSNKRTDEYGGSLENRMRFHLEIIRAVKAVWPNHLPLTARLGVIEFDGNDDQTFAEAQQVIAAFKAEGVDSVDVSMGFTIPGTSIPWGPNMLMDYAAKVRENVDLVVSTTWNLRDLVAVDQAIGAGQLDLAMIGRPFLQNPHYPYQVARELGEADAERFLPISYGAWLAKYR